MLSASDVERFESKVSPEPNTGCWLWTASANTYGYGQFWSNGRVFKAHRVAWMLERGAVPRGMYLLHSCDNRLCVNPGHLRVGTHEENVADGVARGRLGRPVAT